MNTFKKHLLGFFILGLIGTMSGADVILNEYNAVDTGDPGEFLGGGTSSMDISGGRAADSYFGRVAGNGGDWFEMVVITDHLDMRNWRLDIYTNNVLDKTLDLTNHSIWSDLRSGTIITVSEDLPDDISYNPAAGDWWINVQANSGAGGQYIEASSFPVNSDLWQLRIRNAAGTVIFGPAGEGVSPTSGVSGTEVFRLEASPGTSIVPTSADYDAGDDFSTFGSPNQWGRQNLASLRGVAVSPSTLTLLSPNGSQAIKSGGTYPVTWSYTGTVASVLIEFSTNNGGVWSPVYPANVGNTGVYNWLVPIANSQQCLVRVVNAGNTAVSDASNAVFSIYPCAVGGDVTGDCTVDMADLAAMAASWLDCGNPYDPECF